MDRDAKNNGRRQGAENTKGGVPAGSECRGGYVPGGHISVGCLWAQNTCHRDMARLLRARSGRMYSQPAPRPYATPDDWTLTDALIGAALGALIGAAFAGVLPGTQPIVNGGPVAVVLLGAILGAIVGAGTPRMAAARRRRVPAYVPARPLPASTLARRARDRDAEPVRQRVTVLRSTPVDVPAAADETAFTPRVIEDVSTPVHATAEDEAAFTPRMIEDVSTPVDAPAADEAAFTPRVVEDVSTPMDVPAAAEAAFTPRVVEDVQAPEPTPRREPRVVIRRAAAQHEPASSFEELPEQSWRAPS
jgi:hypothetical protein